MVSFLQLASEKKTSFMVNPKQIFVPSYFAKALGIFQIRSLKIEHCVNWPGPGIEIFPRYSMHAC